MNQNIEKDFNSTADDSAQEALIRKFDKVQPIEEEEEEIDHHGGTGKSEASVFGASLNLFKSLVGIGVLALPQAFSQSGWVAGLILMPLCAIAMLYLSHEIIRIAEEKQSKAKNVVEFVKQTANRGHVIAVNACLFTFQTGICISYVIFFLQYIQESFCNIDGSIYPCSSKVISVIISLSCLIPLVFIRDINKLKIWSMLGNVVVMVSLVTVMIYSFYYLGTDGVGNIQAVNWSTIGKSIGVFIFTFEGIGVYFNIRHSMKQPSHFYKVLNYSISVAVTLYCSVGLIGYLTFGSGVNDIILFSFEQSNIPMQIIKFAYCISLIFSFPIQIFPCVNVVESKLKKIIYVKAPQNFDKERPQENNSDNSYISSVQEAQPLIDPVIKKQQDKNFLIFSSLTRLFFVFLTYVIGIIFDKISDFLSLTGNICGIYLCYIIPVFVIYYQDKNLPKYKTILNFTIMIIAIGFGIYGLYCTILQIKDDFF
ncbi:transmembrane amino acid transporter protein (macronuclear) [Tetrahymena thermophila SB210]|uniref:Transmembrane amino acid transporter protein n=1 Tax=Tetrahymena thermophila (strain SB210) TaxID=312017 RepID=I7MFA5_TETTS|nr:transmembrane amino acid transporter protein [Tetrahymena thermophila SB210]EAR83755.1 transmembrane amino acid transporter protein [Tetrahymena thermophila SB210]|eukprot:XP_001031418.1 transmembrane amino acid transporter protein [Tetrahymena thermophila SB210]